MQADLWVAMLESAGIPCTAGNRNVAASLQEFFPNDQIEIYVPRSLAKEARAVLGSGRKHGARASQPSRSRRRVSKTDAVIGFLLVLLVGVGMALIGVVAEGR